MLPDEIIELIGCYASLREAFILQKAGIDMVYCLKKKLKVPLIPRGYISDTLRLSTDGIVKLNHETSGWKRLPLPSILFIELTEIGWVMLDTYGGVWTYDLWDGIRKVILPPILKITNQFWHISALDIEGRVWFWKVSIHLKGRPLLLVPEVNYYKWIRKTEGHTTHFYIDQYERKY